MAHGHKTGEWQSEYEGSKYYFAVSNYRDVDLDEFETGENGPQSELFYSGESCIPQDRKTK